MNQLKLRQPENGCACSQSRQSLLPVNWVSCDAASFLRPWGGAMRVVYDEMGLEEYITQAVQRLTGTPRFNRLFGRRYGN